MLFVMFFFAVNPQRFLPFELFTYAKPPRFVPVGFFTAKQWLLVRYLPPVCWGAALGWILGRSFELWSGGRWKEAKSLCRHGGLACVAINGVWFALYSTWIYNRAPRVHPPLELYLNSMLQRLSYDICLQAAAILFLIGFLIPGDRDRAVYITETVRI